MKTRKHAVSINCEHSVEINVLPDVAFALIDDLSRTKDWLPPCTSLRKVTDGPNAVGDTLVYQFLQGGSSGTMDGEILERVPNERLKCVYRDAKFEVLVDLRVESAGDGSKLVHAIAITPHTWMSRRLTPCIRLGLRKQTKTAMENIKTLLEAPPASP